MTPEPEMMLLSGTGVDVTPEQVLLLLVGSGHNVTPEPVLSLIKETGTDVAPVPEEMLFLVKFTSMETEVSVTSVSEPNVGEETGGISLPSVGAVLWQAGSETNMASGSESG